MSQIKGKNTKPELTVRSLLHRMGYRFRIHRTDLPGKPDIVLPKFKTVIFVNGCFWHRHEGCKYAYNPKSRMKFWKEKFKATCERDMLNMVKLSNLGWHVEIVWECEIKNLDKLSKRLKSVLVIR